MDSHSSIGNRKGTNMAVAKKKTAKKTKTKTVKAKKSGKKSGLAQLYYGVSTELAEVIGTKKATRPEVVKKLWVYIKAKKLQDAKNKRLICPDKKLSEVLGSR